MMDFTYHVGSKNDNPEDDGGKGTTSPIQLDVCTCLALLFAVQALRFARYLSDKHTVLS